MCCPLPAKGEACLNIFMCKAKQYGINKFITIYKLQFTNLPHLVLLWRKFEITILGSKVDPALAYRAHAPLFKNFQGCIFENIDSIARTNFTESIYNVYNVFYALI